MLDQIKKSSPFSLRRFFEDLWHDLRYGLRILRKEKGFTAAALFSLALGIGANTTIFSVINGVLLKPLPYENSDQVVQLWESPGERRTNPASPGAFFDWKEQSTLFENIAAISFSKDMNLINEGDPERISGIKMSPSGLHILRANPVVGRIFALDEDQPGKDKVVVLTHTLWTRRFAGDSSIAGRQILLNGHSYTVIGVLPPKFLPWDKVEFVIPYLFEPEETNKRGSHYLRVIARLKPGVSVAQGETELNTISQRLKSLYPAAKKDWGVIAVPMLEQITGTVKPALLIMLVAVGLVLLIACANVANLLLAKAASREKEMAIRAAMGAGRRRIIQQLLVESILLSLFGAVIGVVIAYWGMNALTRINAAVLPRVDEVNLDLRVLGFVVLVSIVTGLVFGAVPAFRASKPNLDDVLKEGGRGFSTNVRSRIRDSLIVAEVGLALILLVGAGLLVKSFYRLLNVTPGFNPVNALSVQITLAENKYPDAPRRAVIYDQIVKEVEAIPGVQSAGFAATLPIASAPPSTGIEIMGRPDAAKGHEIDFDYCTPNYFRAMEIPLIKGRFFNERDNTQSSLVVIISEALMREYFSDEEPLGQHIITQGSSWEIIGVVGNIRNRGLAEKIQPRYYLPQQFSRFGTGNLTIRTAGPSLNLVESVRQVVLRIEPEQPIANPRTWENIIATSVERRKLILTLLSIFAVTALLLASIGIYGVMSYLINQRNHEIGIRLALGARQGDVLRLIMQQGMSMVGIGLAIGLIGALLLTRFLASQLFEVSHTDPMTFAIIALLLLSVSLLACYFPARRAMKVDPMVAIRHE